MAAVPSPEGHRTSGRPTQDDREEPAQQPPARQPATRSPQRTMLGMAAVPSPEGHRASSLPTQDGHGEPARQPAARSAIAARSHRTVFGMPQASVASPVPDDGPSDEPPLTEPIEPRAPTARSSASLPWLLLSITFVLGFGVVATAAWWWFGRTPDIEVSLIEADSGRRIRIEAPQMPDGTEVTLSGAKARLRSGEAILTVPESSLKPGENRLTLRFKTPDGEGSEREVILNLRFHVRARLEQLGTWPPRMVVEVTAPPNAKAWLDDHPVPLDERGRGQLTLPVSPRHQEGPDTRHEHAVRYRIALPEGKEHAGVLRTRLPVATLLIERPGDDLVTDRDAVAIAGSVAPGASVRLGTRSIDVNDRGRFETTWPLEEPAERENAPQHLRTTLLVLQPGRWPRKEEIRVRRVRSLSEYAARLARSAEPLDYPALLANPSVHEGRRLAFRGYVYHVQPDASARRQVAQMLASPCPRGQRCALWVTFPSGLQVEVGAHLFGVGEAAGLQRFRTRKGQQMQVPRLEAAVLVPQREAPARPRRRRGRHRRRGHGG